MNTIGIAAHARANPAKTALVAGERRISFGELDVEINKAARAFQRLGVRPGDRVAVALKNRPEFFEAAIAAARLGAQVVPVPWRAKADEVAYLVTDSAARILVAEPDGPDVENVGILRLGSSYEHERDESVPLLPEDAIVGAPVVFRYYTSGTTGRPKAVEREGSSPEMVLQAALDMAAMFDVASPANVHLVCGPLYHTAPCAYGNYALLLGQTVVIMERFDAAECVRLIESERVTWTHMVPINFVRILRSGLTADVSSIRRVVHAAAPCPVDVKRSIMEVFPPGSVWEYYGMTEGFATLISPEEWSRKPGSVGRPRPGITLTIRDQNGEPMKPGETGLVYVSTPRRFAYGGDPEKTASAWLGDEFTVGDMGFVDEDGYLFLTDRKVDMIISGGANVYPAEIEAILYSHPSVADVAVIGIPDDEWGESVHAIVQPSSPVDANALIAWCRDRLAHFKCPRTVSFTDSLPRDESGKVRKRDLRDPYWAGRDRKI